MAKVFIATVRLALLVDDAGSASDWVTGCLTGRMRKFQPGSELLDWRYVHQKSKPREIFACSWVQKDVTDGFLADYRESSLWEHDEYGDVGRHYLVSGWEDVQPKVESKHDSFDGVRDAAIAYRKEHGTEAGGLYYLTFDDNDEPSMDAFTMLDMDPASRAPRAMCKHCDHFVEENYFGNDKVVIVDATTVEVEGYSNGKLARYIHLEDGEQEFDHNAEPGEVRTGLEWERFRPDLFTKYPDGKIGPNSPFHSRRGKKPSQA